MIRRQREHAPRSEDVVVIGQEEVRRLEGVHKAEGAFTLQLVQVGRGRVVPDCTLSVMEDDDDADGDDCGDGDNEDDDNDDNDENNLSSLS